MNITENLLTLGSKNRPGTKLRGLKAIALHWLAAPKQLPINTRAWFAQGAVFGSTQYIIGHMGDIMRVIPEDEIAYHVGSSQIDPVSGKVYTDFARKLFGEDVIRQSMPNWWSIGIEMSHLDMNPGTFSKETLESAQWLVADILTRNKKTVEIVTYHGEVVGWKNCPKLWYDKPELFQFFKRQVNEMMPKELQVPKESIRINYKPKS